MKILVLNGSPRVNGNTAFLSNAFKDGAKSSGHDVEIVRLASLSINGCLGCEYCHNNNGKCIQKDEMQQLYPKLAEADMVVLSSPVYYWSFSGQMQSAITRFYAPGKPVAQKYAMILSSGSEGVYDAPISQYKSILDYFKATDLGIKTFAGYAQQNDENYKEMYEFGASL